MNETFCRFNFEGFGFMACWILRPFWSLFGNVVVRFLAEHKIFALLSYDFFNGHKSTNLIGQNYGRFPRNRSLLIGLELVRTFTKAYAIIQQREKSCQSKYFDKRRIFDGGKFDPRTSSEIWSKIWPEKSQQQQRHLCLSIKRQLSQKWPKERLLLLTKRRKKSKKND